MMDRGHMCRAVMLRGDGAVPDLAGALEDRAFAFSSGSYALMVMAAGCP